MIYTLVLVGVILIGLIILYVVLDRRLSRLGQSFQDTTPFTLLNQNIQGMQDRLDRVAGGLNDRLDNAARVISAVNHELGAVQAIGRSLQDVQQLLQSPKLRGNLGEQILAQLLQQAFPAESFKLQHRFSGGEVVDAVVQTDQGLITIDAKFPLMNFTAMSQATTEADQESYRKLFYRDVRKHISDIAKKYIIPEEGTVNFALMYVPAEAVFYEIVRQQNDVVNFAQGQKVFIVSPNSFYYFLKVLLLGMQGKQIEHEAKRLLAVIEGMAKDAGKFSQELSVLTTHITNAHNALVRVNTAYASLHTTIDQIKLLK